MSTEHKLIQTVSEYGNLLQFLYEKHPMILEEFKNKNSAHVATGGVGGGVSIPSDENETRK